MARDNASVEGGVCQAVAHDSAHKHVSGEALYVDDIPVPEETLQVYLATSPHAHAEIIELDLSEVAVQPGVVSVVCAADIPGINDVSPLAGDDPLLAEDCVEYDGQPVFAVVNLARHLDIDPEKALTGANYKFERRFRDMEGEIVSSGKRFRDFNIASLDKFWRAAKKRVG